MKRLVWFLQRKFQAIETYTMLLAFWWFLILIIPIRTFNTSLSYKAMSGIADETQWALAFLLIAVIQFTAMLIDCKKTQQLGLLLSMGIWLFVAVTIALGNPSSTGTGTYLLTSALCGWLYVKVGESK